MSKVCHVLCLLLWKSSTRTSPCHCFYSHRFVSIPQVCYWSVCVCVYVCVSKVPKTCEGQQTSENNRSLPDVVGTKKQISYRTEIIGGVPIVTQTQVKQNTAWISGPGVSRSLTTCVSHIVSALLICTFNCVIVVKKPLQLQEPKKPPSPRGTPPPGTFLDVLGVNQKVKKKTQLIFLWLIIMFTLD